MFLKLTANLISASPGIFCDSSPVISTQVFVVAFGFVLYCKVTDCNLSLFLGSLKSKPSELTVSSDWLSSSVSSSVCSEGWVVCSSLFVEGSFCVEESSVLVDGSSSTTGCSFWVWSSFVVWTGSSWYIVLLCTALDGSKVKQVHRTIKQESTVLNNFPIRAFLLLCTILPPIYSIHPIWCNGQIRNTKWYLIFSFATSPITVFLESMDDFLLSPTQK